MDAKLLNNIVHFMSQTVEALNLTIAMSVDKEEKDILTEARKVVAESISKINQIAVTPIGKV